MISIVGFGRPKFKGAAASTAKPADKPAAAKVCSECKRPL